MRRPLDINKLLSSRNNDLHQSKITKPSFLSKKERQKLALQKAMKEKVLKPEPKNVQAKNTDEIRLGAEHDDISNDEDHKSLQQKKSKFRFDWNQEDDTLAGYDPIVKSKVPIRWNSDYDNRDNSYMGKHWTEKSFEEMTERDWRILREDFHIVTKGGSIQQPLRNWSELGLISAELLEILTSKLKYYDPTPIQRVTIPNVCTGRDFLGVAATGSGKTLAFLIPILTQLQSIPSLNSITKLDGPFALIMAPTRELAQQIESEANKLIENWSRPTSVVSIVGGHSMEEISYKLSLGCDILVATPGRLIDCLDNRLLVLKQVKLLVLDEADRMIDFGFEEQLTSILAKTESIDKRQTMMFTATMSSTIEKVAGGYLKKPAYVSIGGENTKARIKQVVEYIPSEEQRFIKLSREILPRFEPPIIIFINYKKTADWLASKFFSDTEYKVTTLHGSKSQEQREQSLNLLRTGKADIMIATNVAGRGIDVPNVSLVVNFQMSSDMDNYIHRIGRTGRAGRNGCAITFLGDGDDNKLVEDLYNYVKDNDEDSLNSVSSVVKQKFNVGKNHLQSIIT